jgi:hypothetical protein
MGVAKESGPHKKGAWKSLPQRGPEVQHILAYLYINTYIHIYIHIYIYIYIYEYTTATALVPVAPFALNLAGVLL